MYQYNYFPFGLKHAGYNSTPSNPKYQYKYNGKEIQTELGLNVYDMDMRQYDPAIARWVVQDPVIHHSMSPYNAFDNNPIFWADPSGADATEVVNEMWNKSANGYNTTWTNNGNDTFSGSNGSKAGNDDPIKHWYQNENGQFKQFGQEKSYLKRGGHNWNRVSNKWGEYEFRNNSGGYTTLLTNGSYENHDAPTIVSYSKYLPLIGGEFDNENFYGLKASTWEPESIVDKRIINREDMADVEIKLKDDSNFFMGVASFCGIDISHDLFKKNPKDFLKKNPIFLVAGVMALMYGVTHGNAAKSLNQFRKNSNLESFILINTVSAMGNAISHKLYIYSGSGSYLNTINY